MITREDATKLRCMANRIDQRAAGSFAAVSAAWDAAELRSIADAMDEALRRRTQRELEGEARRARVAGLWRRFRLLWSRAA